ncbi:hypothetical protein ACU6VG_16435 [Sphaerotilus sulfidivorans]|uniref:hypothetical protein n=1 Tax=Sphaerotilus sp. FB-3 TaxID=2913396 RepID=UPI00203C48A6|nr:hypothetical protein [Sphaerotilus sp. FB-3]
MVTTIAADMGTSGKKAARTAGKRSPEETKEPEKSDGKSDKPDSGKPGASGVDNLFGPGASGQPLFVVDYLVHRER